jgi:hypothetical protein
VAKRKHEDTTVPPISADFKDIVQALLRTPPPPAGHLSTRKQKPLKRAPKVKPKVTK